MKETRWELRGGPCEKVLPQLPPNFFHSIVTDPPGGISHLGKKWDGDRGGRKQWVAWMEGVARECLRVVRPGGHALVWAFPRTSHWTGWAWENAGWEPRDSLYHLFGSGFPKSLNVSKALDRLDKERARVRFVEWMRTTGLTAKEVDGALRERGLISKKSNFAVHYFNLKQPALPTRLQWEVLAELLRQRRVEQPPWVEEYVDLRENGSATYRSRPILSTFKSVLGGAFFAHGTRDASAYKALHRELVVERTGSATELAREWEGWGTTFKPSAEQWWLLRKPLEGSVAHNVARYGTGALNLEGCRWAGKMPPNALTSHPGGPLAEMKSFPHLNEPRPNSNDRSAEGRVDNPHPTVKSTRLMRYFCRLVTPPGGVVLDPFAGSGSTGVAALREGFRFVGVEEELAYVRIAHQRLEIQSQIPPTKTTVEELLGGVGE